MTFVKSPFWYDADTIREPWWDSCWQNGYIAEQFGSFFELYKKFDGTRVPVGGWKSGRPTSHVTPNWEVAFGCVCKFCGLVDRLSDAALEHVHSVFSDASLALALFLPYWDHKHSSLKVARRSSDYCDFCTSAHNDIEAVHKSDQRNACHSSLLEKPYESGAESAGPLQRSLDICAR